MAKKKDELKEEKVRTKHTTLKNIMGGAREKVNLLQWKLFFVRHALNQDRTLVVINFNILNEQLRIWDGHSYIKRLEFDNAL